MPNLEKCVMPNIQNILRKLNLPAENQAIIDLHKDRLISTNDSAVKMIKLHRGPLTNLVNHTRYVTERLAFDVLETINHKITSVNDNALKAANEILIFDSYIVNFGAEYENYRCTASRYDKEALDHFYSQTAYTKEVIIGLSKGRLVPYHVAQQIMSVGMSNGFRNLEIRQVHQQNNDSVPIPLNGGGAYIIGKHKR